MPASADTYDVPDAARKAFAHMHTALERERERAEQAETKLATLLGADKPDRPATPTQMMRHWMLIASEQKRRADAAEHQLAAVPWEAIEVALTEEDSPEWAAVQIWLHAKRPHHEAQP